jgi:hypothetical protein
MIQTRLRMRGILVANRSGPSSRASQQHVDPGLSARARTIERLCSDCERKRNELLEAAEENTETSEIAEGRWRVKYSTTEKDGDAGSSDFGFASMIEMETSSLKTQENDKKRKTELFSLRSFRSQDN